MTVTKQVSLHGKRAFLSKEDILVGRGGIAAGGDDKPTIVLPGAPDTVAVFDDFHASLVGDTGNIGDTGNVSAHQGGLYLLAVGTDTGNEIKLQNSTNGVIRLGPVTDGTQTPAGTNTSLVGRTHAWKANMGPGGHSGRLRFAARLKCPGNGTVWNAGSIFAGFADTGVLGAGTFPIYDTGASDTGGIAAVADAVGFLYGENADTGIRGVSARGGATGRQSVTLTTTAPTVNKYQVWELELHRSSSDTGGTATFWIDGVPQGTITSPITTAEPVVPYIGIMASDTGAPALDVDWFAVSAPRDTGE
jgi:hypothetical protein